MRATGRLKLALAAGGGLAYAALLAPGVLRAARLAAEPPTPLALDPWLLMRGELLVWCASLPLVALFASARIRPAAAFDLPWRRPIPRGAYGCVAAAAVGLLAALTAMPGTYLRWPDLGWWSAGARGALASWFVLLAGLRMAPERRDAVVISDRRSAWMLAAGLVLYTALLPTIWGEMRVASSFCPPQSVCDGPAYAMLGELIVWAAGAPLLAALLAATILRTGFRPWQGWESQVLLALVAALIVLFGARNFAGGAAGLLVFAGYAAFALWLLLLVRACRPGYSRSTRPLATER